MLHVFLLVDKKLDLGAPTVTKMEPRGVQNRGLGHQKRGLKTLWFSAPEKVTKMNPNASLLETLGRVWMDQGGGHWEPSGAPKQDPCVILTNFDQHITHFNVYGMAFWLDIFGLSLPSHPYVYDFDLQISRKCAHNQ